LQTNEQRPKLERKKQCASDDVTNLNLAGVLEQLFLLQPERGFHLFVPIGALFGPLAPGLRP
jgi:hypothetical protein